MIYFDNAATTFPKPNIVYEKHIEAMKDYGANPGRAGHKMALKANRGIYETRNLIGKLFNIKNPMDIVFTFNCTESLNLGIKGLLKPGDHVITTSMEHNSVLRPIKHLEERGVENTIVLTNSKGEIDPKKIEKSIRENTKLIVTTHVSNLTGTIMPIEEIGQIAKKHNIPYMVDAAQSAGVYDIDVEKMNISLLAFPGHKGLLGPQATGGLYIKEGLQIEAIFQGGTGSASESLTQPEMLPDKYESGTHNGPGIVGLGAGIEYILEKGMKNIREHEEVLTAHFLKGIETIEGIKVYGPLDIKKQGAVVSLNLKDIDSSEIAYILDEEYDIATRSGLHCAPLAHKTIGTLEQGVVRFSFGIFNTKEEVDKAINALKEIAREV
ncbi:aminotransferase class V-fold PLP-dependent enzyme [Tissierella creatinophila]|uniref:cysteine desulfurase n=1 Tax=Tissierella creatinophila DSM 6911 TaxID=1123403 RepID=A0A1U7M2A8_TISCR|nr:aminotransferase class V-fold PLP-dependent enzyme [Tissierella creatinophila]OLS01447.1 putative cysteine desulfurase [Tissierella creatinophila DSM 6911]